MIDAKKNVLLLINSLRSVYSKKKYLFISIGTTLLILLGSLWLPNKNFIASVIASPSFSYFEKIRLLVSTLGLLKTNFTVSSIILTFTIAALFGINISMAIFYIKKYARAQASIGVSTVGMMAGFIGIGCASCGSLLLSTIFGMSATVGFLGFFPFKGQEFALMSILFIGISIFYLGRKIHDPLTCKVKKKWGIFSKLFGSQSKQNYGQKK